MPLTPEDRQTLLKLARETITLATQGKKPPAIDLDEVSEDLRRDGASFVTLTEHGDLRGCIGSLEARRPLILDVRENALAAAFQDPRSPTPTSP